VPGARNGLGAQPGAAQHDPVGLDLDQLQQDLAWILQPEIRIPCYQGK